VPENWVEIEGDSCVMKRDYDALAQSKLQMRCMIGVVGAIRAA
jgi:hypothetical protein